MREKQNILFVIGTRPEAIKLAPLIIVFKEDKYFNVKVCVTAQHRELLDDVIDFFGLTIDYDLDLMSQNQDSLTFISKAILSLKGVVKKVNPDLLIVQGDTSTVLVGSLVAFHLKVKVAHIEAGLRSFNIEAPFPEEMNRILSSQLSSFHFAPTAKAVENLKKEGIGDHVHLVGNTVIDALTIASEKIENENLDYSNEFAEINFDRKVILVSCHRRENFGEPLQNICEALNELADKYKEVEIVMLMHPNPNVKASIDKYLNKTKVKTIYPLIYSKLVWMMKQSYFILTDSGGLQEEAPSLGKPVLVLREVTERTEGVELGTAKLVGVNKKRIVSEASNLLENSDLYDKMSQQISPFGDGHSCIRILEILKLNNL